jgi:uncharacterized metal-binding protein
MNEKAACSCCGTPTLIFSCSGCSDTGAVTDLSARRLTKEGVGKMTCLAGIGGRVSGIMAKTESANSIIVIDGCPLNCAKKTLEEAGFNTFKHLTLSDIGLKKSESPATEENISKVVESAKTMLNACCS